MSPGCHRYQYRKIANQYSFLPFQLRGHHSVGYTAEVQQNQDSVVESVGFEAWRLERQVWRLARYSESLGCFELFPACCLLERSQALLLPSYLCVCV